MVKLIRLTSENDCEFSANMDADIVLNPDSQVAVQNLTFETVFSALDIGANDSPINMNMDTGNAALPNGTYSTIPTKTYTNVNFGELQTDLTVALNDALFVKNNGEPTVTPAVPQDGYFFYGQYNVGDEGQLVDKDDKVPIAFRQSPIVHPRVVGVRRSEFNVNTGEDFFPPEPLNDDDDPFDSDETLFAYSGENEDASRLQIVPLSVPPLPALQIPLHYGGFCKTHTTGNPSVSSAALDAFLAPSSTHVNFCKGSSVIMCRVGSLPITGTKDEEGFAIGLSDKFIVTGDDDDVATIPTNARTYEIRAYRRADNYQFIIPGMNHTPADSVPAVTPNSADQTGAGSGNGGNNDILMICKNGTKMYGYVVTSAGGGTRNKLFEYDIPIASRDEPLYPYAYICGKANAGASSTLLLDGTYMNWLGMTLDPWAIDNLNADEGDQEQSAFVNFLAPEVGDTWASDENANFDYSVEDIIDNMPVLDEDLYDPGQAGRQTTTLTISKEIMRFLGFTSPQFQGVGRVTMRPIFNNIYIEQFGFAVIPNDIFQVTNSDNYVVVIDSHPVLSYDASSAEGKLATDPTAPQRGKRMNIIATIPDNDNSNGAVEYESNELVYIDLDNNFKQNISNLRVRVLNKALGKLDTRGVSVLTLLIKDNARE